MSSSEQGNDDFDKKYYSRTISHYSKALESDPGNYTLYSLRSESYFALGDCNKAAADAKKAIEFKPDWVFGYLRLGSALQGQHDWANAEQAYRQALELKPFDQNIKTELIKVLRNKITEDSQNESNNSTIQELFTENNLNRISTANPQISELLHDQDTQNMIVTVRQTPQNIAKYRENDKFQQILTAIVTDSVSTTPSPAAKEASEDEKAKGNSAFKSGQYEEALQHYSKAIELDIFNITCYNNKATVLNKQGKFNEAIQICEDALKKSEQCDAQPEVVAKTYQKIASAQNSLGNLDEAIRALKSSLSAKKDVQVQRELMNLEAINKRKKQKEYENPELGVKAREEGNNFFNNNEFSKSIECYNDAIKRDPKNPLYYADRAAAYTKLCDFQKALNDCQKALDIDPNCGYALCKRAQVHMVNRELFRAREDYNKALYVQPGCQEAIQGLFEISRKISDKRDDEPDEERIRRHLADPEVQKILRDPKVQKALRECKDDPKMFKVYYNDKEMAENFKVLQAAGIIH